MELEGQSEAPPCRGCCNFNKETKRSIQWHSENIKGTIQQFIWNPCLLRLGHLMVGKKEYYKLTETLFNSSAPTGKLDSPKPLKEHTHCHTPRFILRKQAPMGTSGLEVWWLLHRIFCLPTRPVWERLASFEEGDE